MYFNITIILSFSSSLSLLSWQPWVAHAWLALNSWTCYVGALTTWATFSASYSY
jgi:hypothetical protein